MVSREIEAFMPECPRMPPPMSLEDVLARQQQTLTGPQRWPGLSSVELEDVDCEGVAAVWYRPKQIEGKGVVLYCHGGGYMWSSARRHEGIISRVADACRLPVLALDYKLAPTSPFPGPVEEGIRLYSWLRGQGYDARQVAFVGDSAGGGLVLALGHGLIDAGEPLPACVASSSAWTDLALTGESIDAVVHDPCVSREGLETCRKHYLQGHDPQDKLASPLYGDFSGFPPLLLQVGSREQLLSDSTRVAAKADAAGVEVTLDIFDRCPHLWNWWVPESPEARRSMLDIAEFVRRHIND